MPSLRSDDALAKFTASIRPRRDGVDAAKDFIAARVGELAQDSASLIRSWWVHSKVPPVEPLILNSDYDFDGQVERAARHWEARICAARAIKELADEGYLEATDAALIVDRVRQSFTTVVERSGGNSGGWDVEKFDVRYPAKVRVSPFGKELPATFRAETAAEVSAMTSQVNSTDREASPSPGPIGDPYDSLWRSQLPNGLPSIVATAASRQMAIEDLRNVINNLREVAPTTSSLERKFVGLVVAQLQDAVDLLNLPDLARGDWSANQPEVRSVLGKLVLTLRFATNLVDGIAAWADVGELLHQALSQIGSYAR